MIGMGRIHSGERGVGLAVVISCMMKGTNEPLRP